MIFKTSGVCIKFEFSFTFIGDNSGVLSFLIVELFEISFILFFELSI